jgi:uncharacterized protein (DUF433 family)
MARGEVRLVPCGGRACGANKVISVKVIGNTLARDPRIERSLRFYNLRFLFILIPVIIVLVLVIIATLL